MSNARFLRLVRTSLMLGAVCTLVTSTALPADGDKQLARLKGVVGFATGAEAPFHQIVGRELLPDDDFAITRDKSAALLALPDSSIVAIGEKTRVRVGAFSQTADGPGSTITVDEGTLRFDIRRPTGGAANYRFTTATSQIAVRGTVGLLSVIGGNTTVACLVCAADSVTVTVGTQTIALAAGQVLTVSALGAVVTGTISSTVLGGFAGAQVSTVAAAGPSAATAGVAGASGAAAGAAGGIATTTAIGAAAATAAVAGVAVSSLVANPTPAASPTPNTSLQVQGAQPAPPAPSETPRPMSGRR